MDDGLTTSVDGEVLEEVVHRIVEVARPERIILFGSGARGGLTKNSDLDLLVVKSGAHRRKLAQEIYVNLIGVGRSVDVVVVTPEDIGRFGDSPALVIEAALREGVEVYAA
ncbi:MAG: nucleotidyltransferase domain-containing protein [Rubrobacteraceae bacterium]